MVGWFYICTASNNGVISNLAFHLFRDDVIFRGDTGTGQKMYFVHFIITVSQNKGCKRQLSYHTNLVTTVFN